MGVKKTLRSCNSSEASINYFFSVFWKNSEKIKSSLAYTEHWLLHGAPCLLSGKLKTITCKLHNPYGDRGEEMVPSEKKYILTKRNLIYNCQEGSTLPDTKLKRGRIEGGKWCFKHCSSSSHPLTVWNPSVLEKILKNSSLKTTAVSQCKWLLPPVVLS